MTDRDVRDWYLAKLAAIADLDLEWQKQGIPLEERARRAWQSRHDARIEARTMMSWIEVAGLRLRDLVVYGHADGPTFRQLVLAGRKAGLSPEESFLRIIQAAQTSSEFIDRTFARKKTGRKRSPAKRKSAGRK